MSSPDVRAADGIGEDVAIDVACEREGDDQRRRGQEACLELRMDATGEVAVARENGNGKDAALGHGLLDDRRQRAGIADAGRAAIADDAEADGLEVLQQAGAAQVALGGGRAGRQ